MLVQRLDWAVAFRQQVVCRQSVDAQAADCDTIGDEVAAAAAELIVNRAAVIDDQVALLRRVAPPIDHVDSCSLRDEHDLAEVFVLMHAARHVRGIRADMADVFEARRGILAEGGAVAMIWKILQQNTPS